MQSIQKQENLSTGEKDKLTIVEKTVTLASNILNGKTNVSVVEMNLQIKDTLNTLNIKSVFKCEEKATIAFGVVKVLVGRFMDSFGFATKMNDVQLETLTVDTLENFKNDSLEDIILFFKLARTGKFGATMRGVDSNLIYGEWFPQYLELKAEAREIQYQKEKVLYAKDQLTTQDVLKAYEARKNTPQKKHDALVERINEITEGFTRQQLENLISEWEKDESKSEFLYALRAKRRDIKGDYKF